MDQNETRISIVIPVYNAEASIGKLTALLHESLASLYPLEIILVNDGSRDASHSECVKLWEKYRGTVKYFSLAKNFGEHNAVMAGLNKSTGSHVVIMDDDFQNPVSEVIRLIDFSVENDFDVVYTYYADKKHSFWRNLGSRLNSYMATLLLKKPRGLYLSSFKCCNRFIVNEIIRYTLPYPYIDGLILRSTASIGTIEVKHAGRQEGKSGYTLRKLIKLWSNMFTNFSVLPLRISTFIGLFFALTGFLFGIYSIIEHFMVPTLPPGFSLTITSIFVFAGIQLISLGMIGEYVGRIFISQNKQPQFTVKKEFL